MKATHSRQRRSRQRRTWHWQKEYFTVGQKVRLYSQLVRKLPVRGVVKAIKKNKFGRISYRVLASDGEVYNVVLEELIPSGAKTAP